MDTAFRLPQAVRHKFDAASGFYQVIVVPEPCVTQSASSSSSAAVTSSSAITASYQYHLHNHHGNNNYHGQSNNTIQVKLIGVPLGASLTAGLREQQPPSCQLQQQQQQYCLTSAASSNNHHGNMYRFISQPNFVTLEMRVDPKDLGQKCLEKVCEFLGILNEADYFGLKYENKGEELWLNIRNPIGNTHNRFALRVKFWVPPHLLLQESTRHQFYLHAKMELTERRLVAPKLETIARLVGLIAQAECGDFDAHSSYNFYGHLIAVLGADLTVDEQQTLLIKACGEHKSVKNMKQATAEYWLLKEISTFEGFGEEVFSTRHTHHTTTSSTATPAPNITTTIASSNTTTNSNTATNIPVAAATAAAVTSPVTSVAAGIAFGVGPHGISIRSLTPTSTNSDDGSDKSLIPFTAIQAASSHKRSFRLEYLNAEGAVVVVETKFDSNHLASSLYRAITEKHAFYSCETVGSAVTAQFTRDLKGTLVSIFNEDSPLGKKYVFDIQRTCREVYDTARRKLHQENIQIADVSVLSPVEEPVVQTDDSAERLRRLIESLTCCICMDQQIDTAFLPCAHVAACSTCASLCDRCPLCRADIKHAQKIFLPGEFRI